MADEAAVMEAPQVTTPDAPADIQITEGYQRFDFPSEAETAAPAAPPAEAAPEATPEPEAAATPEAEVAPALSDDELERILKDSRAQARIERLAANKYGTQLQQEREAAAQKARTEFAAQQREWEKATETYNRLQNDSDYYALMVRENGEAEVLSFRANYQRAAQARNAPPPPPVFDTAGYQRQFTEQFNQSAIGEFQNVVKATLPMYGELPEEVRQRVEAVKYDPNGNWLADAMTALGKGFESHIASLKRSHDAALREALEAGKNDAAAAREEATPLVVSGDLGDMRTWAEWELAYAEGRVPRADFKAAQRKFGISD